MSIGANPPATAFDERLAKTGVALSAADAATVKELVKAMEEAAAVAAEPLPPSVSPATLLHLKRAGSQTP